MLIYFNFKYKQLFGNERKLYLKYFKYIEIEFDKMTDTRWQDIGLFRKFETNYDGSYRQHEMIFSYNANEEYPTDKKQLKLGIFNKELNHLVSFGKMSFNGCKRV